MIVNREPFRIDPRGPVQAYQTYEIDSPQDTTVRAACEQVGCAAWRNGWESTIDERTDLGAAQAAYIRQHSRRTFTERKTALGLTVFRFESGQRCFTDHRTRPETYTVWPGDWRGQLGPARTHTRPNDWVEDFGEHQQKIADQAERG